jgi:hypothetical protein
MRTEPLRLVRRDHTRFDAAFYERSPHFWPIARAAGTFRAYDDWPPVEAYARAFVMNEPAIRFVSAPPRRKRPPGVVVRSDLYDARITNDGVVMTRPKMWHDFLNALVWATFPRSKRALHARQHAAIERWIPEGATQLPNARTRELDALALIDEGGVLVVADAPPIVFGHALFEGLVLGQRAMVARAFELPESRADLAAVDDAFAARLADPSTCCAPEELPRLPLDTARA